VFAALIGCVGALVTIGFRETILGVEWMVFGRKDSLVRIAESLTWWQRLISPAIGGVIAGLLLYWAQRMTREQHEGDYMEAIALGNGDIHVGHSVLRALSSLATVASGGAIGREGPMVQLASLAGSLVGRWWALPVPRRRLYVACGAAAGIATAYNAPIAGALFIAEIVLHSLAMASLAPLIVAAVAANLVVRELAGYAPVYQMPPILLDHDISIAILGVVGLIVGAIAPLYLSLLDRVHALFKRWKGPLWLKLGCGGLMMGAISIVNPGVWGNGYSVVNSILQGNWLWPALVAILVWKLLAVSATTGSGAVGGIFTPTLFVGAVLGALLGLAAQALSPGVVPVPAMVVAGMGAFLAACTHAPLMSILMMFEMTQSHSLLVPLMAACVAGYSVSQTLRGRSIYAVAPSNAQPAPVLTMAADLLHPDPPRITQGQSLRALEMVFSVRRWQHTYAVDADGRFVGAISLHDFRLVMDACTDRDAPWPATLLRDNYPRVQLETPAWQVLETFVQHPGERLPVLDAQGLLQGYIVKSDLIILFRERTVSA
jgi:CIC family chloride channel protein